MGRGRCKRAVSRQKHTSRARNVPSCRRTLSEWHSSRTSRQQMQTITAAVSNRSRHSETKSLRVLTARCRVVRAVLLEESEKCQARSALLPLDRLIGSFPVR